MARKSSHRFICLFFCLKGNFFGSNMDEKKISSLTPNDFWVSTLTKGFNRSVLFSRKLCEMHHFCAPFHSVKSIYDKNWAFLNTTVPPLWVREQAQNVQTTRNVLHFIRLSMYGSVSFCSYFIVDWNLKTRNATRTPVKNVKKI